MPPARTQIEHEEQEQRNKLTDSYQALLKDFASPDLHTVGNYTLGRLIGKGSFGKVYLGTHKLTNGSKVVLKSAKKDDANLAREIHHHRQFLHPHIARLYEVIVTESLVWLVLEYCPGDELYHYLLEHGRMEPVKVQQVFTQLVGAVSYVHGMRCVHRDLKLENILLDKRGNVKLVDFGFTREYAGTTSYLQTWCGTLCYSAPEMIKGEKYAGEKVDVWSLGIILYALLCGQLPFDEDDDSATKPLILKEEPQYPGYLPTEAKDLIRKLLAKRPILRPSLADVLKDPWLAEYAPQQQEILKVQQPAPFSTQVEKDTLDRMRSAGVDIDLVIEHVLSQRCDSLAGWWALLIEKEQRKEKRRERRRKEREADVKTLRRLSAANTRLLAQSALGEIFESEEHAVRASPRPRGRRMTRPNGSIGSISETGGMLKSADQIAAPMSPAPDQVQETEQPLGSQDKSRSRSRPAPPPKDYSAGPHRPRNASRSSASMLRHNNIKVELLSPAYVPPAQRKRRTFYPQPLKEQLAWVKQWFKEGAKRAKSPNDNSKSHVTATRQHPTPNAKGPVQPQQDITYDIKRVSTAPSQQHRKASVGARPELLARATLPARPRMDTTSSTGSGASLRAKRRSVSPHTLTPHSSYRRSNAGLRGRKSTSSSVSSIRSAYKSNNKSGHHHSHSKASSTSSASVASPSGISSASGNRMARSPHTSVKMVPSTPNSSGSFPSGIRVSRRPTPAGLGTLPTFAEAQKSFSGIGPGSPGLPVFARRKRSIFKGPRGAGSPSGFGRSALAGAGSRSDSVPGRRSGELVPVGEEDEMEEDEDEVEEVDHFGPELSSHNGPLRRGLGSSDGGVVGGAAPETEPVTPLSLLPSDEGVNGLAGMQGIGVGIGSTAKDGGGVPLTAEALAKMEEQEEQFYEASAAAEQKHG